MCACVLSTNTDELQNGVDSDIADPVNGRSNGNGNSALYMGRAKVIGASCHEVLDYQVLQEKSPIENSVIQVWGFSRFSSIFDDTHAADDEAQVRIPFSTSTTMLVRLNLENGI